MVSTASRRPVKLSQPVTSVTMGVLTETVGTGAGAAASCPQPAIISASADGCELGERGGAKHDIGLVDAR